MNDPAAITRSGKRNIITVKPVGFETPDDLRKVPMQKRNCRFSDEIPKNMSRFKVYTKDACQFDCMADYRYSV